VSGALLVTGLRASPMTSVRVVLPGGAAMSALSIEAQVVRQTKDGFAVEWCELAPEVVRAFAHTDVAVPALIEHDIASTARSVSAR